MKSGSTPESRRDERDRPVLELTGGEPLGVDVGELLELERALHRHRVADVPAEEEHRRRARQLPRERAHRLGRRPAW